MSIYVNGEKVAPIEKWRIDTRSIWAKVYSFLRVDLRFKVWMFLHGYKRVDTRWVRRWQ